MTQPGAPGSIAPRDAGWIGRELADLKRRLDELAVARSLNAAELSQSGLQIVGGSFMMPVITDGSLPGSMWWDDGYDHHGALLQRLPDNRLALQSPWNDNAPDHPLLVLNPATKEAALYISSTPGVTENPFLEMRGGAGLQIIELLIDNGAGGKYSTFVVSNGIEVVPSGTGYGNVFFGSSGDDTHTVALGAAFSVNNDVLMQFGPGDQGLYYYEDWDLPAQSVSAGQQWQVSNGLVLGTARNDYPASAMDLGTGIWTAPENGPYTFTFCAGFDTWDGASPLGLRIFNQTANRVIANRKAANTDTTFTKDTLSARRHVSKGDQVIFQLTNGTTASRTVSATAPETSYISVQREL